MEKLSIVKIGGNIIEDESALTHFLQLFSNLKGKKILVHGGGKKASKMADKLGVESKMIDGRRITNLETLEIITMIYGGLVNKNIIAKLQALNTNAIGLSGADCNCVRSDIRPVKGIDFGFVGDIKSVDNKAIDLLISSKFTPVFCAITHDGKGQLLNTNADTITSQIAIAMSRNYKTEIYYCFELNGVLKNINDTNSIVKNINSEVYQKLLKSGVISNGMIPKLHNCFDALQNGVQTVFMGNTNILTKENNNFTTITL